MRQQNQKLFPANPGKHIRIAKTAAQELRDRNQRCVPGGMPIGIVQLFEVVKIQQDTTKTIEDVRHLVAGVRGRTNVMEGGDMDGGIWSAGQSQGLIHDIPSCEELVKRIMHQAEEIVHARLDRMAAGRETVAA